MEAGNCPTLNMNAMHNYLLSHSLTLVMGPRKTHTKWFWGQIRLYAEYSNNVE